LRGESIGEGCDVLQVCVAVCLGSDAVENYVVPCVSVCPWGSYGVEMWDVVTWACGGVVGSGAEPV